MSKDTTLPLGFRSAVELAGMIRSRELSSLEFTRYFIGRIERFDSKVNAFMVRVFEQSLEAAKHADAVLARGEAVGPLHGLPMTLKESFNVTGLATTWGVPGHKGNVATSDSDVARSLRAAGAHLLGKTNVPFMLGDFQSYNTLSGTTNNPWDPERTPGGSSGGAAAALAAGLTGLECGSDIGGSIRNPAHYCGVYGHKPTWGIVPMQGHELPTLPPAPDLAVVGPLARSAEDLDVALGVLAHADPLSAPGWRLELPPPRRTSLRGLRVALWADDAVSPVDSEVSGRVLQVAELLSRQGAVVSDSARPAFDAAAYRGIYVALVNSIIGSGADDAQYEANKQRAAAFPPGDTSRAAFLARSMVLDHRAWLQYHAERIRMREQWRRFFQDWDILVCPIMATAAFPHDHRPPHERTLKVNGEDQPYFQQVFWSSLATVAYLPATVFPTGPSRTGLPIGLQAIGAAFEDRTTIEFARLMAGELGGFTPPPGFAD
jgi:amidase